MELSKVLVRSPVSTCVTRDSTALRFHKTQTVHDTEVHLLPSVRETAQIQISKEYMKIPIDRA